MISYIFPSLYRRIKYQKKVATPLLIIDITSLFLILSAIIFIAKFIMICS